MNEYLDEWENLVDELSEKEIALYEWKHVYNVKADEIVANTNFKELYGANNQRVRDKHVQEQLVDWHDIIVELEFSIDWIIRRISFLREMVHWETTIKEGKK